jgi:serine O-acetyltransferase
MRPARLWWLSCRAYRKRLVFVAKLLKGLNYVLFKCLLPYEADIQPDVMLEHYALGVVIHPNVQIGHRVRIYHQVTLAAETWIGSEHRIVIGDDVVIGVGASVIGRGDRSLTVGAGARIGAGAVVVRDVAPGQTVVGIPARAIEPA